MSVDLHQFKPSSEAILAKIAEFEALFNDAVAAADFDDARRVADALGLLWAAFSQRMGENRSSESFTAPYLKRLLS